MMEKVNNTQYTKLDKNGFVEIAGKAMIFTVDGHDFDCVVYQPPEGRHPYKWNTVEQTTGLLCGYGRTRKEAIASATERLTVEVTRLGFDEFCQQYFVGRDASPRYGGGEIV
jgi:hypothetical protein